MLVGLATITVLAWAYLAYLAWEMRHMDMQMAMPRTQSWGLVEYLLMFVMWTVMMVAMMAPSAAPMILTFASVHRKRRERERPYIPTGFFLAGYLAVWTAFSVVAN